MKLQILDMLSAAPGFCSGETISQTLGISRAAVCKNIQALKKSGYKIESVTNRGYRLLQDSAQLSEITVLHDLKTKWIGQHVFYREETVSTNLDAKNHADAPDGSLFLADLQTGGRGRLGRAWSVSQGSAIAASLLLKPDILPESVSVITLLAGLSIAKTLQSMRIPAKIKWPNDIILNRKKICGILTEMSAEIERVNYVVLGIGMNVNTKAFPEELSEKATSLFLETGKEWNRPALLRAFLTQFEADYERFLKNGFSVFLEEYEKLSATIGQTVRVVSPEGEYTARAVGINADGELLAERDGKAVTIRSGEVSVRGLLGYV